MSAIGTIVLTLQAVMDSHMEKYRKHATTPQCWATAPLKMKKKTCKQLFSLLLIYLLCVPVWGKFL